MTTYQQQTIQIVMEAMQTARLNKLNEDPAWVNCPVEIKEKYIDDYNSKMYDWLIEGQKVFKILNTPAPRRSERLAKKNKK